MNDISKREIEHKDVNKLMAGVYEKIEKARTLTDPMEALLRIEENLKKTIEYLKKKALNVVEGFDVSTLIAGKPIQLAKALAEGKVSRITQEDVKYLESKLRDAVRTIEYYKGQISYFRKQHTRITDNRTKQDREPRKPYR